MAITTYHPSLLGGLASYLSSYFKPADKPTEPGPCYLPVIPGNVRYLIYQELTAGDLQALKKTCRRLRDDVPKYYDDSLEMSDSILKLKRLRPLYDYNPGRVAFENVHRFSIGLSPTKTVIYGFATKRLRKFQIGYMEACYNLLLSYQESQNKPEKARLLLQIAEFFTDPQLPPIFKDRLDSITSDQWIRILQEDYNLPSKNQVLQEAEDVKKLFKKENKRTCHSNRHH